MSAKPPYRPGEEPTYDARPEVDPTPQANHVYLWYSENNGHPFVSVVYPLGCSRGEALTRRPAAHADGQNVKVALVKVPLSRDWLS